MARVIAAEALEDYRIKVQFDDGAEGIFDMSSRIRRGPVSMPLVDPVFFARVTVNAVWGCLEWPNGFDVCPDALYREVIASRSAA